MKRAARRTISGYFLWVLLLPVAIGAQSVKEMRVMTYNIRYKNAIDSINNWENRKANVAALIKYHQAGIIGMQEAFLSQIADLEKDLPGYRWYGVPRVTGSNGECNPVFYREDLYTLLDKGTFWYSETPYIKESKSWDAYYPRIASWCKFRDKHSGREFFFFNTHFDHRGAIARNKSAEVLRYQVDSIAGKAPVIITGDFNSTPSSTAYGTMTRDGALRDALLITETPHYGPENSAGGFFVSTRPISVRIDYIFVSKNVKVLQHASLTDQQEGRYYSDHLPVLSVVELIW
ncbi:MAG TPA: endonuclease/exonuclease/phosphatase family protein [Niabella sp.]